jgi:hypothetical protein
MTATRLTNGRTAYANTTAPQLPSSLAASVTGIVGAAGQATPIGPGSVLRLPLSDTAGAGKTGPTWW